MAQAIVAADMPPGLRCIALEVRESGLFESPNGLQSDFMSLVESAKPTVEAGLRDATESDAIVFVLVAFTSLNIAQVASPVEFPAWVPVVGGCECLFCIELLVEEALGPVSAPEANIASITAALFELDKALLGALEAASVSRPDAIAPFVDSVESILDKPAGNVADLLAAARRSLDGVTSPESYRPTLGRPVTPVTWIGRLVQDRSPKSLPKDGARFLRALGLSNGEVSSLRLSLPALLFRSSFPNDDATGPNGANVMASVFAAFQYTSAAAHADRYPQQLLVTLHATSIELIETLTSVRHALLRLNSCG